MELHKEEIEAAGLRVVAVGLGKPKHARHFGDRLAPSVACVTTDEPVLHQSFGIGRGGSLRMVSPDATLAGVRAVMRGHVQGKATGDVKQLPGTFIVDANGIVRFAHYSKYAGDHPDLQLLLKAWAKRAGSGSER